ncbi:hypothetical protein L7F22_019159 [Adiantum nelumboides]|nr:hypothetical protein [Adiantum nelumboides]
MSLAEIMMRRFGIAIVFAIACFTLFIGSSTASSLKQRPNIDDWKVTSIVRTIELSSVSALSDVHTIKPSVEVQSEQDIKPYYFALSALEAQHISGLEATARYGPGVIPKQRAILRVAEHGPLDTTDALWADGNATASRPHLYSIKLPLHFLQPGSSEETLADTSLTITGMLVHASTPLPASVGQTESQNVLWKGSAALVSVYEAGSGRIKVKSPQPTIVSYSTEPALPSEQVTKSGSTITFGPFSSIPSLLKSGSHSIPPEAKVHYLHNSPILTIVEADRKVKISHWKNRLEVEDRLWLRNDGAKLKGHFSRVQHQLNALVQKAKTHTLSNLVLQLPPGVDGAYFIDESGNVSTSNFRPKPPSPSHVDTPPHLLTPLKASLLDVRPRYPLLGGWNYTCSIGWYVKLTDGWLKTHETEDRRFITHIPFLPAVKDTAIDDATLRIIFPEGSKDISFKVPFAVEVENERSWSFLDTIGKPVLKLHKKRCSERHGGMVTVEYTLTTGDQYRKALIALLAGVLIAGAMRLFSKIDLSIKA